MFFSFIRYKTALVRWLFGDCLLAIRQEDAVRVTDLGSRENHSRRPRLHKAAAIHRPPMATSKP
jgi:hypothetical protein